MRETDVTDAGELRSRIAGKLRGAGFVLLTTSDGRGQLRSRPVRLLQADFDGVVWVDLDRDRDIAADVRRDPRVNVAVMDASDGFYLSVSGVAVPKGSTDDSNWHPEDRAPQPRSAERSGLVPRLKIEVTRAEVWTSESGGLSEVLSYAKAALLGRAPQPTEPLQLRL
jgi:general stress protein 26